MNEKVKSPPGKWRAYGLVRDSSGKPKIDNVDKIHEKIWELLTDEEKDEVNKKRKVKLPK